jgi:pimeloyl-ACP methyl ester carboxylesterase
MAELARTGRTAVVIEPLGFGGSSRPAQADYSFTTQADRVATTMGLLAIPRAVVVAQSSASSIALRLAIRHPDRVRAIVSIEGGAAEATLTAGLRRGLRLAPLLKLLGGRRMVRRAVRNTLREGSADGSWVTEIVVDGYMPPPEFDFDAIVRGLRGMSRSREPDPLAPSLGEIACPVRVLIGGAPHGGGVEPEELRILQAGVRHLTVVTVPGSGHFLNEENPSAVRQAIDDAAREGALLSSSFGPGEERLATRSGARARRFADRPGGEPDVGKYFGDVGIPHAVRTPGPAARVLRRRRFLVLVETREIHAPDVAVLRR